MTKEEVFAYIKEAYRAHPDHPWEKYPENHVFRHSDTGKWFALLIDSLSLQEGYHRAYHMNKTQWLTVELNGKVPVERVEDLIDMSFDLTDKN